MHIFPRLTLAHPPFEMEERGLGTAIFQSLHGSNKYVHAPFAYLHIDVFTYLYVYRFLHLHIYAFMYLHDYICMELSYLYTQICIYLCIYVFACSYMQGGAGRYPWNRRMRGCPSAGAETMPGQTLQPQSCLLKFAGTQNKQQ